MPRLLFEKKGSAVWISHLDLMRVFQRAFKRAGLPLKHTQGFNPRPSVSIALPLSVGVESSCELLDFDLYGESVALKNIRDRLNNVLVEGVRVLDVYEDGRKIRDLSLLRCTVILEYDNGFPADTEERIRSLFAADSVIVPKKTKSGVQDQNIIPMIQSLEVKEAGDRCMDIEALICCQNPTLNPAQIPLAISTYLGDLKPDHFLCSRKEVFDVNETIFR